MNKKSTLFQIGIAFAALGLAILACGPTPTVVTPTAQPMQATPVSQPATNPSSVPSRASLIAATVQIFGVHIQSGRVVPFYVGSGSIISSDGLILTNAHVANPAAVGETGETPDALVIGIVQSEDKPPVYAYRAEVRAIDGFMDLAVIQITSTVKGDSVDPSSLNLPHVALGNSDSVHVGDHLSILGFPAIGGDTITFTSGDVSGFSAEENLGDRAWIKTDATISGGNSGGMGTNDQGLLIGVPSIAASGAANTEASDCRVIQDTNGDGVIDNKDTCIPVGGFINGLRPVNLALPLIKAAESGQTYTSPYTQPASQPSSPPSSPSSGNEQIGPITRYSLTSQGKLDQPVTSYPSGATALVAVFKFSGFTNGETLREVWLMNGTEAYSGNYTWDQGSEGTYYTVLHNQGDPLPDGSYHVALYAGDSQNPLSESDVTVGSGATTPKSTGKGIKVSGTVTDKDTGNPVSGAYVIVLNTGVGFKAWKAAGYDKSDILTYTQTDSNGQYTLPGKLARNTPYTVVVSADGYPDTYGEGLTWDDSAPSNFTLNLPISQ